MRRFFISSDANGVFMLYEHFFSHNSIGQITLATFTRLYMQVFKTVVEQNRLTKSVSLAYKR